MTRTSIASRQLLLFEPWPLVERSSRRARCVRVEVRRDGVVVLVIPQHVSRRAAHAFLEKQRSWVERTRSRLAARARERPRATPWDGRSRAALRQQAAELGRELLDAEAARLGVRYTRLTIRDVRSRWGSCGADGRIMLALRLALAPLDVFRYVAIHELCHLRWRGHGARFWGLVARQMPDFAVHRAWLREHGEQLHAARLTD